MTGRSDGGYAAGCLEGECHYLKGNLWARKRVDYVKTLLPEAGLEPERVEMYNMSSAMGAKFAEVATEFTERIKALGPNPVKRAGVDAHAAAREALKNNKIGASMLSVLRRAGDMHRQIKAPGFECAHMEIDVGVIPAVRLRYRAQ